MENKLYGKIIQGVGGLYTVRLCGSSDRVSERDGEKKHGVATVKMCRNILAR